MDTFLPSHPERNSALLVHSFRLYAAGFWHVLWMAFLLSFVLFLPQLITNLTGTGYFYDLPLYSSHRLWFMLINLIDFMLFIAIIWSLYCVHRGYHEPFIEDIGKGLRKTINVFLATVLANSILVIVTLMTIGFLQFINAEVPQPNQPTLLTFILVLCQVFIILYIYSLFVFLLPIIAIEDKSILSAIKRNIQLVWNHWWRVFSLQVTPWVCCVLAIILFKYILFNTTFFQDVLMQHPVWGTIIELIAFALFIPWVAALLLVQLRDLELRKKITQQDQHAI